MAPPRIESLESEMRVHDYRGTKIPWFVRAMWLLFWVFAISYTLQFMIPALQKDFPQAVSPDQKAEKADGVDQPQP